MRATGIMMFRGKLKTTLSPKYFSVGSLVTGELDEDYLVVFMHKQVHLLNLSTFEVYGKGVQVADENFLSEDEAHALLCALDGTFTDYDLIPKGMKK